jgi:hypothetical protein
MTPRAYRSGVIHEPGSPGRANTFIAPAHGRPPTWGKGRLYCYWLIATMHLGAGLCLLRCLMVRRKVKTGTGN